MEEGVMKEVEVQLHALRPILLAEHGNSFLDLFDEFMQQREFGLALHAVCDFILDPHSPQINKSILGQIERLHVAMRMDDRCMDELQRRVTGPRQGGVE